MSCEHIVEDGQEARVPFERVWGRRHGSCGTNREVWVRGGCVEVGEEVAIRCLRMWEYFLGKLVRYLVLFRHGTEAQTMLGLEASEETLRESLGNGQVMVVTNSLDVSILAPIELAGSTALQ